LSARPPEGPSPWRSARPELAIAAIALAAAAGGAYAVAGGPEAVWVVVVFSALSLAVTSRLLTGGSGARTTPTVPTDRRAPGGSFIDHWRMRWGLSDAITSMSAYRAGLGPNLEHLLAARLSERHGVSLYGEPDLARSILCRTATDADLWAWVDPARPPVGELDGPGIPARTLARLLQRLEQL